MKTNTIILAFLTAVAYSAPVENDKPEQDSADVLRPIKFGNDEKFDRVLQPHYRNYGKKPEEKYGYKLAERDVDTEEYFLIKASDLQFETIDNDKDDGTKIEARDAANNKYISYKALQRDTVPCSRRGASYYNCKPGAQANPYTRGCNKATKCRGKMIKRWLMDRGLGFVEYL
ncbi:Protein RALF-like 33 [Pseudocercospora fuligena]|uniref:Protein RALF-like 33 n=1 Tax=Pseudocercospora fuligena TaxID=685502 RepID=A0A8H6R7Y0_9PEZI|nr:Protein RALF-like 33 [Pseudocercospora fuligena]